MADITATRAPSIDANLGYQQITNVSAAVGLTIPVGTTWCVIQAETQNVRYRDDGTDPSTTVGMLLAAGTSVQYSGNLAAIKFIEVTTSAKLNVSYYR